MISNRLIAAAALLLAGVSSGFSQSLPIADGAYLSKEHCNMAEDGELDMVGFMVEQGGRSVLLYESSCLVAEVNVIRGGRYDVQLDCREFEGVYQHQFFLDVLAKGHIRVDGEDNWHCTKGFLAPEPVSSGGTENIAQLIDVWAISHENCSGGFGDDPATKRACAERSALSERLGKLGMCFGRDDQSRSQFDWHKCGKGSLR